MRRVLTGVLVAALALCCGSAFAGQTWTDGDGDGLPDGSPFVLGAPGPVSVDVWIDSQSFLWTNYLVFVEWQEACLDYVSAAYIVSGGTNFPIDRFSNPSAVGFGGFGFNLQGVTRIGSVNLNYTGPGPCCVQPIIDYNNPNGTYCALGNGPAYFLFTTNFQTCWRGFPDEPFGACCMPSGGCVETDPLICVSGGGVYQGDGTDCSTVSCPQPTEACCFPDASCQALPVADCVASGGTPQGPGTSCATVICDCPPIACCFPDGSCADMCLQPCIDAGGIDSGSCAFCLPTVPRGACCFPDASCGDGFTVEECAALGGVYQGENVLCSDVFCQPPSATESKSWGEIKGLFR